MDKIEYEIVELPIDEVNPSPDNPRKDFDEEKLAALRESIEQHGLLEPILVRKANAEIIDGERRWRAEKAAGKKAVAARMYDVDRLKAAEIRFTEQVQRADLTDQEKENAVYALWLRGSEEGHFESKADMARATGIAVGTLSALISAKQERLSVNDQEIQEASYRDLMISRRLEKLAPEARRKLLRQRQHAEITQEEMRSIADAVVQVPEDLRIPLVTGALTPEMGLKIARLDTPEERYAFIAKVSEQQQEERWKREQIESGLPPRHDLYAGDYVSHGMVGAREVPIDKTISHDMEIEYGCQRMWDRAQNLPDSIKKMSSDNERRKCLDYVSKTHTACQTILEEYGWI